MGSSLGAATKTTPWSDFIHLLRCTNYLTPLCCALQHLLKDIKLFATEAEKVNLDSSLLKGLEAVISQTISKGLADTDYSAVYEGVNPKH